MSDHPRVFSEKQASEILQRAARLQEEKADQGKPYTPGITEQEILRIAEEAGIDPAYVRAAMSESTREKKRSFLNLVEEEERVLDVEIDVNDFDQVVEDLKPTNSRHQHAMQVGRTLRMQTFYRGGMYVIEMSSRNGRTRIAVRSIPVMAYFFSLHPALLIGIIAGANIAARGQVAAGLLFMAVSLILGCLGFAGLIKRGKSRTSELADRIEKKVGEVANKLRSNLANSTAPSTDSEAESVEQR